MQSHSVGNLKGVRLGANLVKHSWVFPLSSVVNNADIKLCTLPGSAAEPLCFSVRLVVITANNSGTVGAIALGTTVGGVELLNASDLKAAAGTNYVAPSVAPANSSFIAKTDTDIWMRYVTTGTAPTTGEYALIIESFALNVTAPNS